ncbi:Vps52/Sac2 [Carpediemonas membranifera]|uniref:Vps52/Sac2 n=1 Tax=Carpediemonas membranifera TaxID=201153 RepID=A0A8J6EB64_9EUKA|nr:Vps52/Sac2 [Carpediemonas membranifera]|eukprot:KAG9396385.1 Vps52/Sac2 [Carpediemonas membranifera]
MNQLRGIERELGVEEEEVIQQYVRNRGNIVELSGSIDECDGVLEIIENTIAQFQSNLYGLSGRITELQDETNYLYTQLQNRKRVEKPISDYIRRIHFTPDDMRKITECPVDTGYIPVVKLLESRLEFSLTAKVDHIVATTDVVASLQEAKRTAEQRIRTTMVKLINQSRRADETTRSTLLSLKPLFEFLRNQCHDTAVTQHYIDFTGKLIAQNVKQHLNTHLPKKDGRQTPDTLVSPPSTAKKGRASVETVISLGELGRHLHELGTPDAIIATTPSATTTFATGWVSALHVLASLLRTEGTFATQFFSPSSRPVLEAVVETATRQLAKTLKSWITQASDIAGILTVLASVSAVQRMLFQWKIPGADPVLDDFKMICWPRFKAVFDTHLDGLRSTVSTIDPTRIHPVVIRYAMLQHTINSTQVSCNEPFLTDAIVSLRDAMDAHLHASVQAVQDARSRSAFFMTTYSHIISVLEDVPEIQDTKDLVEYCRTRLDAVTEAYTKLVLAEEIEPMVSFVDGISALHAADLFEFIARRAELDGEAPEAVRASVFNTLEHVCVEFMASWRGVMANIGAATKASFSDRVFVDAATKAVVGKLLQYYTKTLTYAAQSRLPQLQGRGMLSAADIVSFSKQIIG